MIKIQTSILAEMKNQKNIGTQLYLNPTSGFEIQQIVF